MERLYLVLTFGIEELSKRSISFNITLESLKRGGCARGSMRHPRPLTECAEVSFRVKEKLQRIRQELSVGEWRRRLDTLLGELLKRKFSEEKGYKIAQDQSSIGEAWFTAQSRARGRSTTPETLLKNSRTCMTLAVELSPVGKVHNSVRTSNLNILSMTDPTKLIDKMYCCHLTTGNITDHSCPIGNKVYPGRNSINVDIPPAGCTT